MLNVMKGEEEENQTYLVLLLDVLKFADPAALVPHGCLRVLHWTTGLSFEITHLVTLKWDIISKPAYKDTIILAYSRI